MDGAKGSAAARAIVLCVGRGGVVVSRAALQLALGGQTQLHAMLERLTISERVAPGARTKYGHPPKPKRVLAYVCERGPCPQTGRGGQTLIRFPFAKLEPISHLIRVCGVAEPRVVAPPAGSELYRDYLPLPNPYPPPEEPFRPRFEPYDYQAAVARRLLETLSPGTPRSPRSAYLCMDTGLGKTVTALMVSALLGPALLVVPTQALADQALEEAAGFFGPGFPAAQYSNLGAKAREGWEKKEAEYEAGTRKRRGRQAREPPPVPTPETHRLVAVVVNTAREKGPSFFEGYALVVLDEAHELTSAANYNTLWASEGAPRRLGLSASPLDRPDELDVVVTKHLGPIIDAEQVAEEGGAPMSDVRFRGEVREVWYEAPPGREVEVFNGDVLSAIGTVQNLAKDPYRTRLVAAEVARLFNAHRDPALARHYGLDAAPDRDHAAPPEPFHIFVFSEVRDYLDTLAVALRDVLGAEQVWLPELDDLEEAEAAEKGEAAEKAGAETSAHKTKSFAGGGPSNARAVALARRAEITESRLGLRAGEFRAVGGEAAILRGGSADKTRTRARDGARVTLMTYGYGRRGLSFKKYAAFVAATPRKSQWRQITGRILRRGGDERVLRCIVDVVDASTRLKNQVYSRRAVHRGIRNFEVRRIDATAADFATHAAPALDAGPGGGRLV